MENADKRRAYKNSWQNKFRAEHRIEVLAKQRKWYADRKASGLLPRPQPKRDAANKRTWHQKHKDRMAEKKSWYARNKERGRELGRQSYQRNKQAINERRYALRERDPTFNLKQRAKYHGVSFKELKNLLTTQDGKCAICATQTRLHIDHDHKTMAVRGLLCRGCNTGLGHFGDSLDRLKSAVSYIESRQPKPN
jgi:hypothetical protein